MRTAIGGKKVGGRVRFVFSAMAAALVFSALVLVGCGGDNKDDEGNPGGPDVGVKTTYKVTFNPDGGTVSPTSDTTGADGKLSSLPTPTRDGYIFDGWYTAKTGGTKITESRVYSSNTTVYARWVSGTAYTITFDANSGTVTPTSGKTGADGTLSSMPTPTKSGDTFIGWYTARTGGTEVTTSTVFNGNKWIYAQWASGAVAYSITFLANCGDVTPTSGRTGEDGTLSSLPTPTRSGDTFVGWYTTERTGGTEVTTSTVFNGNKIIWARWASGTKCTYTITFNANGGTVTPASGTTDTLGRLSSLPTPTRSGYTFDGWYFDTTSTGGTMVATNIGFTSNTTVYARWTAGTAYTIRFNANGGSVTPTSGTTIANGTLSSLPTPTKSGYTFDGWYTAATGGTKVTTSTVFSANTTVYAHWVSGTVATYTITFNANSGSVTQTSGTTEADGTLSSLPTPTKSGYTFDGWYTAATGGTKVTTSTVFSANTTVYAHWVSGTVTTYTITFDADGGTVTPTSATTGADGTLSSLPTPARSGYIFDGWYTALTGLMKVTENWVFSANTRIYARWTVYKVWFDATGGTVTPESATPDTNGKFSSLPTPTRTDCKFTGWFTSATGGTQVTANTVFSEPTTIYARWSLVTIWFDANGGVVTPNSCTLGTDGTLSSLPTPTRSGYTFDGWYTTQRTGGTEVTTSTTFSDTNYSSERGSTYIYARWSLIPYTITFDANGGTVTPESGTVDAQGKLASLPTPTRSGYNFVGWYTTATGGTHVTTSTEFKASTTIYALWNANCESETYQFRTVTIGTQTWMAENLNCDIGGSTCYDNNPVNCTRYGRLYRWEAAKVACPSGWHLPSFEEWKILEDFVGGYEVAGKKLKSTSGWNWFTDVLRDISRTGNGTDEYGFSALPGGWGEIDRVNKGKVTFGGVGDEGLWWENESAYITHVARNIYGDYSMIRVGGDGYVDYDLWLRSVRCIQNVRQFGE